MDNAGTSTVKFKFERSVAKAEGPIIPRVEATYVSFPAIYVKNVCPAQSN